METFRKKKERRSHSATQKGFVQVIEVAIATLLIVLIMPVFFSGLNTKQDWARHDLMVSGAGIIRSLEASGNISGILSNTQELIRDIEALKPSNVKYSIYVEGTPKQAISIACASCSDAQLSNARSIFTPALYNGRTIAFRVEKINLDSLPSIPGNYDVAVFMDYADSGWASQKQKISNYLESGKGIVAIQKASDSADFLNMFNLSGAEWDADYQNFTAYYRNRIERYFLGFGLDAATPNDAGGAYNSGNWYIWETPKEINTSGTKTGFRDSGKEFMEGDVFSLAGADSPDGREYSFKVKKIWPDKSGVVFQALNKTFVFRNFWESGEKKVEGNNILNGNRQSTHSLMARNNTAIWISDFPAISSEYRALAKAAAASLAESFYLVSPQNVKNGVNANAFESFCCDMPETAKFSFSFWYVY